MYVYVCVKTRWRLCWSFSPRTLRHQESFVKLPPPIFLSPCLLNPFPSLLWNEPLLSSGSSCTSKAGLHAACNLGFVAPAPVCVPGTPPRTQWPSPRWVFPPPQLSPQTQHLSLPGGPACTTTSPCPTPNSPFLSTLLTPQNLRWPLSPLPHAQNINSTSSSADSTTSSIYASAPFFSIPHCHHCHSHLSFLPVVVFLYKPPCTPLQDVLLPLPCFSKPIKFTNHNSCHLPASAVHQAGCWILHLHVLQSWERAQISVFRSGRWGYMTIPGFRPRSVLLQWNHGAAGCRSEAENQASPSSCLAYHFVLITFPSSTSILEAEQSDPHLMDKTHASHC